MNRKRRLLKDLRAIGCDFDSLPSLMGAVLRTRRSDRIKARKTKNNSFVVSVLNIDEEIVNKIKEIDYLTIFQKITLIVHYLAKTKQTHKYLKQFDGHTEEYEPFSDFKWCITSITAGGVLRLCIKRLREFSSHGIDCILVPGKYGSRFNYAEEFEGVKVKYVSTNSRRKLGMLRPTGIDEEHGMLIGNGLEEFPRCVIDSDLFVLEGIDEYVVNNPCYCEGFYQSWFLKIKNKEAAWYWSTFVPPEPKMEKKYIHLSQVYKPNAVFFGKFKDRIHHIGEYNRFADEIPNYENSFKEDDDDYFILERVNLIKKMREEEL
jgi:hypothetical protein